MARPISVRGLTEGAILAALVAVLALAANYVPLVGLAANFLCPIPLAVLMIRHGLRVAALATVVAIAIGRAISGPLTGVLILLGFAPVGLAIGLGLRRQWSASTVILVTGAAVLGALVLGGVAAKMGVGVDPRVFAREVIELNKRSFDEAVQRYGRLGLDTRQMDASVTMMQDFFDYSYRLIPMLLLVGSFISAYLNYEVARHVLRRVGVRAPALPPMSMWGLPAVVLWVLPLLSLLAALGARRVAPLEGLGTNLVFLIFFALLSQGVLAGWVLMEKYRFPKWYRVIVILLFSSGPTGLLLFLLGLADAALDLRRRWRPSAELRAS